MKILWIILFVAVLSIVLISGVVPFFGLTSGNVVSIGAVLPLTGAESGQGEDMQKGMLLAQTEINRTGGVNGVPLTLEIEDDGSDTKGAIDAYNHIRLTSKINAVITLGSPMAMALSSEIDKDNVFLFAIASAPPYVKKSGFAYRILPSAEYEGEQFAKISTTILGVKKIAVIYVDNDYGKGEKDSFVGAFVKNGGEVLFEDGFNPGESDYLTILTKINSLDVDALYIGAWAQNVAEISLQAKKLGIDLQILCGQACQNRDLIDIGGNSVNNLIFYTTYLNDNSYHAKRYKELYDEDISWVVDSGYKTTIMISEIMKLCGEDKVCFADKLHDSEFTNKYSYMFDNDGEFIGEQTLYQVKNGEFVLYK